MIRWTCRQADSNANGKMKKKFNGYFWPKLIPGILLKRYKRFLADVKLIDGRTVTAHCPNSGNMTTCCEPGRPVYLSFHDDPKRKLKYTWELIEMPESLVGVNTRVPNLLVEQTLREGGVDGLAGYDQIKREVKTGNNSRLDFLLSNGYKNRCFVEVKNCTLVKNRIAMFPDAVTARGLKHLGELRRLVLNGCRGVIFFLVQRMDADRFRPADRVDPAYGEKLRRCVADGVEIMVFDVRIDMQRICLNRKLPYEL